MLARMGQWYKISLITIIRIVSHSILPTTLVVQVKQSTRCVCLFVCVRTIPWNIVTFDLDRI